MAHEIRATAKFGPALVIHQKFVREIVDNESISIPSDFKSMEVSALSALVRGLKPSPRLSTSITSEDNFPSNTNVAVATKKNSEQKMLNNETT